MKIPVNLSSQPFRRDRALVVASAVVSVMLAGTLGLLISLALADNRQLADVRRDVARLNLQVQNLSREQGKLDQVLHQPANAEVLERSVFLNSLLLRKGVSWNRIFNDLEKVVPYNVRLIRIHPSIDSRDHVTVDMQIASDTPGPVYELLKALGESPLFEPPHPSTVLGPSQAEPFYRATIGVTYVQKL
jgi:hypothetical protein